MYLLRLAALGLVFSISGLVAGPAAAGGLVEAGELEHARLNALAGGPVSERDAELLERWGCLSGTRNPFCERLAHRWHRHRAHRRRARRH